ncbi:hypothetical protein [Alicyclobacillus kakegawensis]|uniref:hypothetical protein n=1 Tax=Alicyclobacillus kakegawensis TaxID=392012 RepID=UPI00082DA0BE|nr:hypothetical protein [Alicyclobacillus kakegawensis]
MQTSTKKHLSATVAYLLAGLLIVSACLAVTGWALPEWAGGQWWTKTTVSLLHGVLLGFLLTVAYGVLYQVVPIAFQAPPMPRHVLYWHLPLHLAATAGLLLGFVAHLMWLTTLGGLGVLAALLAFLHFLYHRSYTHARNRTPVYRMLVIPMLGLVLTFLFGLDQAARPAGVDGHLVLTHAVLGGLVFWGGLVMVISYKFVPMFALSHGYRASLPRTAAFYFAGCGLLAAIQFAQHLQPTLSVSGASWLRCVDALSAAATLVGLGLFSLDMQRIVASRKRRRMVFPLRVALAALCVMLVSEALLAICAAVPDLRLLVVTAYLFLFAGLVPLVFAYTQKIVPFLWFEYRFSKRPERKSAPLIDDMVPPRLACAALTLYALGTLLGCLLICGLVPIAWQQAGACVSAALTTAGALILFTALCHVLTIGGQRPAEESSGGH